ncbi:hypothetical protein PINS_up022214 [Pythium insidiosum]|nr:hypothetical protein PINS_up022214 [Pythium insidiosum]
MENSNVMFEFVLMKLLSLLRIFSYSKPLCSTLNSGQGSEAMLDDGLGASDGAGDGRKEVAEDAVAEGVQEKVDEVVHAEAAVEDPTHL